MTARGRRLTIEWANLRCGDVVDLLDRVQVRENVRAVHLEVLARTNPALDQRASGCLGVGVRATTTVTLDAPLGARLLLNALSGVPIPVRGG